MNSRSIYILSSLLLLGLLLAPTGSDALTGGPDGGGYTFDDSVAYSFEDIAHLSNSLDMPSDDKGKQASIGFDFMFYGSVYNTVYVSSNGHIDFKQGLGNEGLNDNSLTIPQPSNYGSPDNDWGMNPLMAVFFDDLDPSGLGEVYAVTLGSAADRRFIVQWEGIAHFDCHSTGGYRINDLTFQAILYEATGEVVFQYQDVTTDSTSVCLAIEAGASATVGLDYNDIVGLQYSANTAALSNGLAILFSPGISQAIVPSATSIDFGTVVLGDSSTAVLKLSNTGGSILAINSTTGLPSSPFSVINDDCTGSVLAVGEHCLMSLVYAPTLEGALIGNLIINSTDPNYPSTSPLNIVLEGLGAASVFGPDIFLLDPIAPYNDLRAEMAPVDIFTNASAIFTVINNGASALAVNSVTATPAPFAVSFEDCTGAPLAVDASCVIDLGFKSTKFGDFAGELVIVSDDPDESPLMAYASITANDALVANITASPSAMGFANTLVFNTTTETLTLGNNGTGDLDISSVAIAPLSGYFTNGTDACTGVTLAPAGTCDIDIDFTPGMVANGLSATLTIVSSDTDDSPLTIDLTGNGLSNPPTAPVLIYPAAGAKDVPTDLFFKWEHSTDPDPGDTITYYHYYSTKAGYLANASSFTGVTPFGPIAKASAMDGLMYAAASTPAVALLMAILLAGPMDRRRRIALGITMVFLFGFMLMACGNGLFGDDDYQLGIEPWAGHQVNGLTNGTDYAWQVVAVDNHDTRSIGNTVWFFTTAP